MSKILQSAKLSFDKQKTIIKYFIPLAIVALIFTIIAVFVIKLVWFKDMNIGLVHMIVIPLLVSIIGTIGDLAESMFKREFGIKDSGDTLGEHGGILDRFDSMIFVLPIVFYYFKFIVA